MPAVVNESPLPISSPAATASPVCSLPKVLELSNLRGVRWRVNLGILPSSPSSTIEDFRRVAADSRRKYASLRRRLLVDPHLPKDGSKSPDLVMDNPLSQNPDSMWGRFFRNAELEKMLDQDLSRLYPEHGSYFQTSACQAMLRRILLLWCLRHPEYGYRQGMHELLAPLLFVLHFDIQHLSEVRKAYEDHFTDEFDEKDFSDGDVISNYRFTKSASLHETINDFEGTSTKSTDLEELDSETRNIILLSDAYGAEGELGILLSERFMEHDAYCLFDALMNGSHGVVAMAEFFSYSPITGTSASVLPVIEASSAVYHLLSIVDLPLHTHLVELGVEPHYFGMRWLRVLFGREFTLGNLLVIWDEVFSSPNGNGYLNAENDMHSNFKVLASSRGAFIAAMAVSMILHLRSSLLATENATSCLQKLLNFPEKIDVKKLIEKARTLQTLVEPLSDGVTGRYKSSAARTHSLSFGAVARKTATHSIPESYWEEKWRVLHRTEELQKGTEGDPISSGLTKGRSRERFSLSRTESDPSPSKTLSGKIDSRSSVRRSLFGELSQVTEPVEHCGKSRFGDLDSTVDALFSLKFEAEKDYPESSNGKNIMDKNLDHNTAERSMSGENSLEVSTQSSPHGMINSHDSDSEKSSVTSNSCAGDDDRGAFSSENSCLDGDVAATSTANLILEQNTDKRHELFSNETEATSATNMKEELSTGEKHDLVSNEMVTKDKKPGPTRFPWFWKFGRGPGEGVLEKGASGDLQKPATSGNIHKDMSGSPGASGKLEVGDKKVMGTLRNLGQTMLENIQVIESAFQQERGQPASLESLSNNILGGKGQATAFSALTELRKISNLLSEM